jgi:hypothetical protein
MNETCIGSIPIFFKKKDPSQNKILKRLCTKPIATLALKRKSGEENNKNKYFTIKK